MTTAPLRQKRGLGAGATVAVLSAACWLSCQPGELPCDQSPEWQAICSEGAGSVGGAGGAGGTGGGDPTGGAGGVNAATPVADCPQWPNLGEMDKFFSNRCAAGMSCHVIAAANIWSDLQTAEVWRRMRDKTPIVSCKPGKMINSTAWQESVIWAKVQAASPPVCPPGASNTGITMPPQAGFEPKLDPVNDAERKCLEGYLKAIAGQ